MSHQNQSGKFQAPLKSSSNVPCEALPAHLGEDNPRLLSVSWPSFAVVLSPPKLGQSSPELTSRQLLHRVCPHHAPAGDTPGFRVSGEGQRAESPQPPCSSPCTSHTNTSRSPASGTSVWKTNALPPLCFLRDELCIHQGAVWSFAVKSCVFHFSFFSSSVFFFSLDLLAGMVCGGMVNY